MLTATIENVLNRGLPRSPRAQQLCAELTGRSVAVEVREITRLLVESTGSTLRITRGDAGADAEIVGGPFGLLALGGNYFQQTAASGQPTVGVPGDTAFGIIQQGYVEASNVDPVTEITNLISAQRAYEMNSKVIQAADQMSGTISNMRG